MYNKHPVFFACIVSLLFFIIPFLYFYLRIWYRHSIFTNDIVSYVIISVLGLLFSLFLSRQFHKKPTDEHKNKLLFFFAAAVICYGFFLFSMTMSNYYRMVSQSIDIQYYHAELSKLSEFIVPKYEWSQHFEPILFFIVPLYWFFKIAGVLMFLQAVIFISGIVPIYLTVKRFLNSRFIGISLSFAYLAFGGTQFGIAYGFHPIMFFPTVFFWMYYFYIQRKVMLYILFLLFSLFVKEEVSFIMIFWGFYLLFIRKDKMFGFITTACGIFWYIFCFQIFFPIFNPGAGFGYWGQYNQTQGTGIFGLIKFALLQPLSFLQTLITPAYKIDTFFQSFGSFGFLLFLFPQSFIIVLPSLLEKLLSNNIAAVNGTHYSAALTGVTLVATIESLYTILNKKYFSKQVGNYYVFLGVLIFYLALFFNILYGYYAFSLIPATDRTGYRVNNIMVDPSDENLQLLSQVIDSIPSNVSVSAEYQIIPHIHNAFTLIHDIPEAHESSDYVLVDTQLPPPVLGDTKLLNKYLDDMYNNKKYTLVVNTLGIVMFKKK